MNVIKEQLCTTTLYMRIDSYSTGTNSGKINEVGQIKIIKLEGSGEDTTAQAFE